jgi:hypothetical protein
MIKNLPSRHSVDSSIDTPLLEEDDNTLQSFSQSLSCEINFILGKVF